MNLTDTIVALSTPPGKGAIAVVRLSGPGAKEAAEKMVRGGSLPEAGRLERKVVVDPGTKEALDDGMVVFFAGPSSYTGDDVVEFHLHGSPLLVSVVLELLGKEGVRQARPGEFTLRAFVNGKKDLTQAEAVSDLVDARSVPGLKVAADQALGGVGDAIRELAEGLLTVISTMEAELDFPEDIPETSSEQLGVSLTDIRDRLQRIADSFDPAMRWKDGYRVALAGSPNAGKSSLFNALLGRDRAIVTEEAGTTRDFLEEFLPCASMPILLVDTAGIRDSDSEAERAGVQHSMQQLESANLVCLLKDPTREWNEEDRGLDRLTRDVPRLVLGAKCDLATTGSGGPKIDLMVSSRSGEGLLELESKLEVLAEAAADISGYEVLLTSRRQRDAVLAACRSLTGVLEELETAPRDILASAAREGLENLNEITGKGAVTDQILDRIFNTFCIGK